MTNLEVELTDIAHGGFTVGHEASGRAVFARFGLPGETVRIAVTKEKSKLVYGDVVEVIANPSPHRVDYVWKAAGPLGVGGANLSHVSFDFQAQWKTHALTQALRRIGGEALAAHLEAHGVHPVVSPIESDRARSGWGNRTRIECVIDDSGRPAMYREGTHELVAIDDMPLAVEDIDELELFSGAWAGTWEPGDRVRAVIPSGSDPVVVVEKQTFAYPGSPADPFVREDVVVGSELFTYRVHASGFWQVHREAASSLTGLVLDAAHVQPGDAVVEYYSGAGLLSQPLALAAGETGSLRAFEGARLAVEDARANLRDIPWASARTSRVDAKLVEWEPGTVVVADPPRAGLGLDVAQAIARGPASRIVLVSCDPAAMARDIAAMVEAGRTVTSMKSIDMFPNTHHFEVVTALSK